MARLSKCETYKAVPCHLAHGCNLPLARDVLMAMLGGLSFRSEGTFLPSGFS
jgi:hypothetical protein